MLDDLKFIHERDSEDTLGIAQKQWKQLLENYSFEKLDYKIENIVFAGMGGSSLSALVSTSWPGYDIPFEIVRNYTLPRYVSENTLFIACSYSGNTEETLSALAEAETKKARIAIICSGGKLLEIAKAKNYPLIVTPLVGQPRYAALYILKALLTIVSQAGIIDGETINNELTKAADFLKEAVSSWAPDRPTVNNQAKQIAQELIGKSIVVYSGPVLYPAAYKWKISFNENAKHIAWLDQFPEFKHNEILGWTKQPVDKPYSVIDLRSNLEHPRVQKSFLVTEKLLSGLRPSPIVIEAKGDSVLHQLLWTIALGDHVSLYLALLNNLDPAPVDLIERLKAEMDSQ